MSPRAGGEADKVGNLYESTWTVMHLLYVLHGRGHSVEPEGVGDAAEGSEFTYRDATSTQAHQLKRQHGLNNHWTVASLKSRGVWASAKSHVVAGRQYHFVSTVPAQPFRELADKSRQAANLESYIQDWLSGNKQLQSAFDELAATGVLDNPVDAYMALKGTYFRTYDEQDIDSMNEVLAETILDGGNGRAIASNLATLILRNLGKVLTRDVVLSKLPEYAIRPVSAVTLPALVSRVNELTRSWSESVERQQIQPVISRPEAAELADIVHNGAKLTLVTGTAGGGKSGVARQAVAILAEIELTTLCFRLDRLDQFSTTSDLGERLGLDRSPVAALALAAAADKSSVLMVDQLDAVSFASGRMPDSLDAVADLVREAEAFPKMRVVWICRKFDVQNDDRIRSLIDQRKAKAVAVDLLTDEQVNAAAEAMGIPSTSLRPDQRQLLRTPFNLSLLSAVADDATILGFDGINRLLEAYWERKRRDARRRRSGTRFGDVVRLVADEMSARQTLSIPASVLDNSDLLDDADVLVSEHILTRDGTRVAFAHEAMFDYAFARAWTAQGASITTFLEQDDQELFRRGQLRQILIYLRQADPSRFTGEFEKLLLSSRIRFHLKDVALSVLGTLINPSSQEADAVLRVILSVDFTERIWRRISTPAWFDAFDRGGRIEEWTLSTAENKAIAVDLMARAVAIYPDRVSEVLSKEHIEPDAIRYVLRFASLENDDSIFALFLDALRQGVFSVFANWLWLSIHELPSRAPDRAIALLRVYLEEQEGAFDVAADGKVALLTLREHSASEFVRYVAEAVPRQFCEVVIPYLVRVMRLTERDTDGFGYPTDQHFWWRNRGERLADELDDALLSGAVHAIEKLAASDQASLQPFLDQLAAVELDTAQYLLYTGLIGLGRASAEQSALHMLGGIKRLFCGYRGHSVWTTRRLLQVTSPYITASSFEQLEVMVRDLHFPWERKANGWYAFALLSALDETRLSDLGGRRLGEYRRKFGYQQPPEPQGVTGGSIGPPIPPASAQLMSDQNWLEAIQKHAADRSNWDTFKGGARELSHLLRERTKEEPLRFASLCLNFDATTNPAYGDAVLMGIGDAEAQEDKDAILRAVKHIASLGKEKNDRWLGWALRPYQSVAPLEIVELVRDHALSARDPEGDGLRFSSGNDDMGPNSDLEMTATNTARGSLIEALGDLVVSDADGSRTVAVAPVLKRFASDLNVAVRVSVAHLLAAVLRHDRPTAVDLLPVLTQTDDSIFTATPTQHLLFYIGSESASTGLVMPMIERMLRSDQDNVNRVGGQMAALAAMEWTEPGLLEQILDSKNVQSRRGAAEMCAGRLSHTSDVSVAKRVIEDLTGDEEKVVREAAATVALALRGKPLRPFASTLRTVLESAAFDAAMPQILFTLERAPDRVDDLIALCAERFVTVSGADSADIRTGAAGDASQVGKLVIRALAQSEEAEMRSRLLDVLDGLLLVGSFGIDDIVARSERGEVPDDE
ncbi:MAG: hypothetical protein ACRDRH_02405 [Pseudonocardia sp.]